MKKVKLYKGKTWIMQQFDNNSNDDDVEDIDDDDDDDDDDDEDEDDDEEKPRIFAKRLLDLLLVVRSHKLSTSKICQKITKEQPATRTPLHVIC